MSQKNSIAVLGIHTGIGKTIASAVIAEAIGADYWKPVQAGTEEMDSPLVRSLLTDGANRVHKEAVVLSQPLSPHAAAAIDKVEVDYTTFQWPVTDKTLLVETAGGILSPMSATTTMADFVAHYNLPAILVVQNYLGSINHTLLSIEVLKARGVKLLGLVISGNHNEQSEQFIQQYSNTGIIARIPHLEDVNAEAVAKYAQQIKSQLQSSIGGVINQTHRYSDEQLRILKQTSGAYSAGEIEGYSVDESMERIKKQIGQ